MVLVCGEALIDVVENPDGSRRATPGGGPFNTARALARLGVPTAYLGHLSSDAYGLELARLLAADGATLELADVGDQPTTLAKARLGSDGRATYEFKVDGTSAPLLAPAMVPDPLPAAITALHVGTLGLVLEPMASTLAGLVARERSRRLVMVDPNVRPGLVPDEIYRERLREVAAAATVVKASEADLAWLFPGFDPQSAAERILEMGVRLVAVTRGEEGAFALHRDCQVRVDAVPVDVVDTIGAGDAFGAGLLAWLHDHDAVGPDLGLRSDQLRSALEYASRAAALTCTRPGAEPPWRSQMAPPA